MQIGIDSFAAGSYGSPRPFGYGGHGVVADFHKQPPRVRTESHRQHVFESHIECSQYLASLQVDQLDVLSVARFVVARSANRAICASAKENGADSGLARTSRTCHSSPEENDLISLFSFAFSYLRSAPFGFSRASDLTRGEQLKRSRSR